MFSHLMKALVVPGFALFMSGSASQAATFELLETGCTGLGGCGEYALINNSEDINVVGFLVGNSDTRSTDDDWEYWGSMVITPNQWNNGLQLEMDTPGDPEIVLDTSGLFEFATYFGEDLAANAYWIDSYLGVSEPTQQMIRPGETRTNFFWYDSPPASEFIVIGANGSNDIVFSSITMTVAAVPLPASLPLMLAGLGLIGLVRRRNPSDA